MLDNIDKKWDNSIKFGNQGQVQSSNKILMKLRKQKQKGKPRKNQTKVHDDHMSIWKVALTKLQKTTCSSSSFILGMEGMPPNQWNTETKQPTFALTISIYNLAKAKWVGVYSVQATRSSKEICTETIGGGVTAAYKNYSWI